MNRNLMPIIDPIRPVTVLVRSVGYSRVSRCGLARLLTSHNFAPGDRAAFVGYDRRGVQKFFHGANFVSEN
jgi:hypothetical protein